MKAIRNTKLFNNLKKHPEWDTLFLDDNLKDSEIPILAGGLDHIDIRPDGIYFHDIGSNNRDNSFVIRREL